MSFITKVVVAFSLCRLDSWYILLNKPLLVLLPPNLLTCIPQKNTGSYNLWFQVSLLLSAPKAGTKFKFAAPFAWNQVQNEISLMEFVALNKLEVICK